MKVPLSKPYMSSEVEDAVLSVLRSGRYIGGPQVDGFEKDFAAYLGMKHVVTGNSATSIEMLALETMGIGPGDGILVPSHTAFPTVEPIFHVGAVPVFVDIDDTFTMDIGDLESKITPKTKVIIPVHLYGHPANIREVMRLARTYDLKVLEDCAQAHGAKFNEQLVGTFGDAAFFSFFPSKNLGTVGDGGAFVTNNSDLADKVKSLRDHGRSDRYGNQYIGYNLRFDSIKAAALRVSLPHLDSFTEARRKNAEIYRKNLAGLKGITLPVESDYAKAVYHLFVIKVDVDKREPLREYLSQRGIETNIHYPVPCHKQFATLIEFGRFGIKVPSLPKTERVVDQIVSLPMYPTLSRAEIDYVTQNVRDFFGV